MIELFTAENAIALLTLTAMEIVLGIDNIVFISILVGRLPEAQRGPARRLGLGVAMLSRIALLTAISYLMRLTRPMFDLPAPDFLGGPHAFSGKDLILLGGGLFLIFKATTEIHHKIEGHESASGAQPDPNRLEQRVGFGMIVLQIMVIDIVFSLDSVITAVGMAEAIEVMIAAVVIAVAVMMLLAGTIGDFVERHPTVKMLALAFLMLIGVILVAEGLGRAIPKGYVYFAMAFSLGVETLNLRAARKHATQA